MTDSQPGLERDHALFLDLDGTLVDIAPVPDAVEIDQRLPGMLSLLSDALDGALALVSGRSLADLDHLLAPHHGAAAGVHGLERRLATGAVIRAQLSRQLEAATPILRAFAAAAPGVELEDKGLSKTLHYRRNPVLAKSCLDIASAVVAMSHELTLSYGKMAVEILPRGANKSTAILAYLAEPPFRGRKPVFVADDLPDEEGFAIVNRFDGISIRVGAERPTEARYRLSSPQAVWRWLGAFLDLNSIAATAGERR